MNASYLKCMTLQKDSIIDILNFHERQDESVKIKKPAWKVLIYDKFGQDIISPLFTISELRDYGVTLHLLIDTERDELPDTCAIYFVYPSEENLQLIENDIVNGRYFKYYLSFITAVSRVSLENLAYKCVEYDTQDCVNRIFDEHLNFISLDEDLFVCRHFQSHQFSFSRLNSASISIEEMNVLIDKITESIFSLITTLGIIPIIKSQKGSAAEAIAKELEKKLRDSILESKGAIYASSRFAVKKRPLLFLYDRCNDLCPALHHTWTYQALLDDIYKIELNRVEIDENGSNKTIFDLLPIDKFMCTHKFTIFPEVAGNIQSEVDDYKSQESSIKALGNNESNAEELLDNIWATNTSKLTSAVDSIPELLRRKKFIDMHTNIASSLMDKIKDRKLDILFEIEESILSKSLKESTPILDLIKDKSIDSTDKLRLFMIAYLCDYFSSALEISQITSIFNTLNIPHSCIKYVTQYKNYSKMSSSQTSINEIPHFYSSVLSRIVSKSPEFVYQGVKNLVMRDKHFPLTSLVISLLDGKYSQDQDLLTLNPMNSFNLNDSSNEKDRTFFDEAIVFVVGGGCYSEYENLVASINKKYLNSKKVIYGCTEMMNPSSFLSQLNELGKDL